MLRHGRVRRLRANPNLIYDHCTGKCDTCVQRVCIFCISVASGLSPASLPKQHTSRKHQTERQSLFCAPKPPSACSKEGGKGLVPRRGEGSGTKEDGGGLVPRRMEGVWYQGGGGGLVPRRGDLVYVF